MRSSAVIFIFVDGPDGALDVLHAHEALVQRQVVPHRVLEHGLVGSWLEELIRLTIRGY